MINKGQQKNKRKIFRFSVKKSLRARKLARTQRYRLMEEFDGTETGIKLRGQIRAENLRFEQLQMEQSKGWKPEAAVLWLSVREKESRYYKELISFARKQGAYPSTLQFFEKLKKKTEFEKIRQALK